ncbi:MAG TPA: dTMP kinase [Kofleriaceae bacterium]|nr:dTMP kinase [Kofleriaceae bacterium]
MLIVIEGLDGAGTTTQAKRLVDTLNERGRAAIMTREPSDGPVGKMIREMLVGKHALGDGRSVSQPTFSLLFAADRMDHVQREVQPALARGTIVVSDRWYHSSLAYQGTGAERAWIRELNRHALRPDLTIFLRVRAQVAAERRVAAGRAQELFEDLPMQERVAANYETVMKDLAAAGERIEILDGEQPLDDVTAAIVALVP